MYKKITYLTILFACASLYTGSFAQTISPTFPYVNDFTSMEGITKMADVASSTYLGIHYDNGEASGIRLTNNKSQFSGIVLKDVKFDTKNGIAIQFEYSMYGGTPYNDNGELKYGDGLALVLYDPRGLTNGVPLSGSAGSGLGYNGAKASDHYGLSNGYLGIALDQFGNNKWRRDQTGKEGEYSTGIKERPSSINYHFDDRSFVTVRGPMLPGSNRKEGYPVLLARATHNDNPEFNRATLNPDGSYLWANCTNTVFDSFDLRGGKLTNNPDDKEYRKTFMELFRALDKGKEGYYLRVSMKVGHKKFPVTSLYFISTTENITYMEPDTGKDPYKDDVAKTLSLSPPEFLNIGFTASTGGASQIQVIRNVDIYLPFSPLVEDDTYRDVCSQTTGYFTPILNDSGYRTNIVVDRNMPGPHYDNLDLESFRFMESDGKGKYHPAGTFPHHEMATPGGMFHYNKDTGKIRFVPYKDNPFADSSKIYLYYDIKNKLSTIAPIISTEDFRSVVSRITFEFQKCKSAPVTVNPHITSWSKIKK